MRLSRIMFAAACALVLLSPTVGFAQGTKTVAADVAVTVTYKGAGTVDREHEIWVFLFDTPEIGAGSRPVATIALTKNGDTATFKDAPANPVYVGVAFDEGGTYDGTAGPPPAGSPIGIYQLKDAKGASPVKHGQRVKIVFDDSSRMK